MNERCSNGVKLLTNCLDTMNISFYSGQEGQAKEKLQKTLTSMGWRMTSQQNTQTGHKWQVRYFHCQTDLQISISERKELHRLRG